MKPYVTVINGLFRQGMDLVPFVAISCLLYCFGCFVTSCPAADLPRAHGAPLEESINFYQFTDEDDVIHFVDSPEKIPQRYRSKVIVRKDRPSARQVTRVVIFDNHVHVPATLRIGSTSIQSVLLLDTGASITCITEEAAARLNIAPEDSRPATVRLADGREIMIRLVKIDSISIGDRVKAPFEIGVMQHIGSAEMHDGLLGLDFLGDIQYQLDLPNGQIHWQ